MVKRLNNFPTPKFTLTDCIQQWSTILEEIYSHLCMTDTAVKAALIDTGPRPFTLECMSPWGRIPQDPDISAHTDLINDVLLNVRAAAATGTLTACR